MFLSGHCLDILCVYHMASFPLLIHLQGLISRHKINHHCSSSLYKREAYLCVSLIPTLRENSL
jgi:hypothetical protein